MLRNWQASHARLPGNFARQARQPSLTLSLLSSPTHLLEQLRLCRLRRLQLGGLVRGAAELAGPHLRRRNGGEEQRNQQAGGRGRARGRLAQQHQAAPRQRTRRHTLADQPLAPWLPLRRATHNCYPTRPPTHPPLQTCWTRPPTFTKFLDCVSQSSRMPRPTVLLVYLTWRWISDRSSVRSWEQATAGAFGWGGWLLQLVGWLGRRVGVGGCLNALACMRA